MMIFSDSFLEALGSWQNGWNEDQARRLTLLETLMKEAESLPEEFRTVNVPCYRKRFLQTHEVLPLLFRSLDDGFTSWSTNRKFSEEFKYRMRRDTITGVVFRCEPRPKDVVLNVPALWAKAEFEEAAKDYLTRQMPMAAALFNFHGKRNQFEVVMKAPLNPEDIVTLSGETNTSFDDFCQQVNLPVLRENAAWKSLLDNDLQPGTHSFIRDEAALRVIVRAIDRLTELLKVAAQR